MKRTCFDIIIAIVFLFCVVEKATAQNPTMSLLDAGLTFGNAITGTTTIAYNNAAAAEFEIQFTNYTSATASITFILPTTLTDGFGDNLPVSFATNSAAYNVGTNSTNGATVFNPNAGIINATVNTGAHNDYFWIGGTATPGNNYVAAAYSGTITASITMTVGTNHYSASLDIPVTATLQGNVSLSATGTLNFGQIVAGTTPPSLSALATDAPMLTATSNTRNHTFTVTFSSTKLNDGLGNQLTFTPSVYASAANVQSGASSINSGAGVRIGRGGHYYFWLGGSLGSIPIGQPSADYSGTFVITVTF